MSCTTPGIVLVHDLTNRKSHQNLQKWLAEVLNREGGSKKDEFDPEHFVGSTQVSNMLTIVISNFFWKFTNNMCKIALRAGAAIYFCTAGLFSDIVCLFKHPSRRVVWYSHCNQGAGIALEGFH